MNRLVYQKSRFLNLYGDVSVLTFTVVFALVSMLGNVSKSTGNTLLRPDIR